MNDAMSLSRRTLVAVATVFALFGAQPAAAQSLFSTGGLGLIADPMDARGAALGGTSLGFPGAELSWDNPAGAVGLPAAGLRVSFQLDGFDATFAGRSAEASTARFPLLLGAFPFGNRWTVTAGFAGFLDQNWAFEQRDTLVVGTDSVEVLDRIASEGGASRFRVGTAYRLLPSLSIGLGAELFTGGSERVAGRIFPGQTAPVCCTASWTYSGAGALASVDWTPSEAFTVALSASAGGSLDADATSGEDAVDRSLVDQGGARDSWSLQGGVEAEVFQLLGQPVPLRIGARTERLPFRFLGADNEWADETAFSGGTGMVLGGGAARLDLSMERGTRGSDAAGLKESYWRLLFSATVLGR